MTDAYLRPRQILDRFSRLYPEAWKQVDEFRASRKELGDWPDWCFLPLSATYAIVTRGKHLHSVDQAQHVGILGALAAWRVTQGIYRFDPTTFDALWKTPVSGDIPTEVLFHLPEWCVYIPTPDQTWQGATLNGFFAHLEHDMNDRRTELRLVLDVTGAAGDELIVMPIHLGKGGVSEGVQAMMKEAASHFPVVMQSPEDEVGRLVGDVSPWSRWSSTSAPKPPRSGRLVLEACAFSSQAPEDQEGRADLRPGSPEPLGGGLSAGAALRQALSEHEPAESTGTHASPRPHIRRAHWHSFWVGKRDQPDARKATLKWLPPIPVNVQGVEDLTTTVRDVGNPA